MYTDSPIERLAIKATQWVGTPASIIVHTFLFIGIFGFYFLGVTTDSILLILTTAVSLEAIYLAIFIQMTVNRSIETIADVSDDLESIEEEVKGLGDDVEEMQEDVKEIEEDIDKMQEEDEEEEGEEEKTQRAIVNIENDLRKLLGDIASLKQGTEKQ
ncbi:MAG: hypothetical protein KGI50_03345 [Patescibacteria group bacterium]|nr:hypothetical protein [Patescibacteria group bacterium]MDE2438326.1 hypothetical protein [Patescibacteria group bacterium]